MNLPRKPIEISNLFYVVSFATVFLLLLIVMSIYSTFVYLPGLPVNLSKPLNKELENSQMAIIKTNGNIIFDKKEFTETEFFNKLNLDLKTVQTNKFFNIFSEPGTPSVFIKQIIKQLEGLNIKAKIVYDFPDLPVVESFIGATASPVFVAVDPEGLFFFEDQLTDEAQLRIKLSKLSEKTKEPLTLVIIADKSVPYEFIIKLGTIAHSAGINKILLAAKPPPL